MRTLIVLNPHSWGGRAGKIFRHIEEKIYPVIGDYLVAITHEPETFTRHLDTIKRADIERILILGGDGTNYTILNALAERPELNIVYGTIPMGTGKDWARSLGISTDPFQAHQWIGSAEPVTCDLGRVDFTDVQQNNLPTSRLFLNVASAGISRDVASRVNRSGKRAKTCFFTSSIISLLTYKPHSAVVECDGRKFFEGPYYIIAVANGCAFGRGMRIAPHALLNDGLFDLIAVEAMSRHSAILSLPSLYRGTHLDRRDVHFCRAKEVAIRSIDGKPIELNLDGEEAAGTDVRFSILPGSIRMLMDPRRAAIKL